MQNVPEWLQTMDETVLRWIGEHLRVPALDGLVSGFTGLGDAGALFIILAVILLLFRTTRRAGGTALTAMTFGLIVTNLTIKPLVSRARPWVAMENFAVLVTSSDPNSFPSGHTCAAFAFAVALCMTQPQRWAKGAVLALAALMGFSRLYVGVHFPSDVLAGAVIGSLCGLLAGWMVPRFLAWVRSRRSGRTPPQMP